MITLNNRRPTKPKLVCSFFFLIKHDQPYALKENGFIQEKLVHGGVVWCEDTKRVLRINYVEHPLKKKTSKFIITYTIAAKNNRALTIHYAIQMPAFLPEVFVRMCLWQAVTMTAKECVCFKDAILGCVSYLKVCTIHQCYTVLVANLRPKQMTLIFSHFSSLMSVSCAKLTLSVTECVWKRVHVIPWFPFTLCFHVALTMSPLPFWPGWSTYLTLENPDQFII